MNIDLASIGTFIKLLLNRSGIKKKQFTLIQSLRFFFLREMVNSSSQQNGTQNETSSLGFSSSECIAWLTVFMTESVAIVTLNILTVIVFMKNRSLRKRSMYLVINLAVADMFVGGCTLQITCFVRVGRLCAYRNTLRLPLLVEIYINFLFPVASLTNLAAISLERAYATFRPFRHRIIKKWVFGFIITIIWVTSGLLPIAIYLLRNLVSLHHIWNLFSGFCLFVICASYVSIAVKISCGAHPQHHGAASRKRKLTKTLFIVTVVSLLLWLPYTIFTLLSVYLPPFLSYRVSIHLFNAFIALFFGNSLVNPIVYAVRMPDFKRALVSLF